MGPEVPADFGEDGYVLSLPGRLHVLPMDSEGRPDPLAIMDDVRDWAMDELGHGWPELCDDDGHFVALLEPVRHGGGFGWSAPGGVGAVQVGGLSSVRTGQTRHCARVGMAHVAV